jgi:L-ascorbate metabolism protein UlaG (beta-lactamase superfamily)
MATTTPTRLTVRVYDVGFGDCFLLTFHYAKRDRHVLTDFGTTHQPEGKTVRGDYMGHVAEAIRTDCGGKLDAVVVTHRHADHLSGFTRKNGKGSGDIIRALAPELVVQPWTEDPRAAKDATAPARRGFARSLVQMQAVAGHIVEAASRLPGERFAALRQQLRVIGATNIANPDAVENLRTMAPNRYVYHGADSGLARLLPGVKVRVLGPPTVEQSAAIKTQRSTDPDEFWNLRLSYWRRLSEAVRGHDRRSPLPFPRRAVGPLPRSAGWFKYSVMQEQGATLLSIVRMLDQAMNNTSVVLLFEVGGRRILFPGDAQYENWMYTLRQPALRKVLADVDLYKVGHHGSLNATPKTLWNGFVRRGAQGKRGRLQTILSTRKGVHGSEAARTEVPRRTLLSALQQDSDLLDTETFAPDELRREVTLTF